MESSAREHKASSKKKEYTMDLNTVIDLIEGKIADLEARIDAGTDPTGNAVLFVKLDAYRNLLEEIEALAVPV